MVGTVAGCGSRRVQPGDQGPPSRDAPAADVQITPDAPLIIVNDTGRSDGSLPFKQRVARVCAFAQACAASVAFPLAASECVEWFAYRDWPRGGYTGFGPSLLDRLLSCAPAKDCKSFHSCFGGTWVGPTACRTGGECSKNMLYTQSNNAMFLHCNVLGGTCVDLPTGAIRACCATKTCAGTSATTCHPNPGGSPKKGTHCMLGIAYDFDCAPMGQSCSPLQGQLCVGPGAYCNPKTTPVSCTGSVAKYCVSKTDGSGNIATVDCAKNALHSACNSGKTTVNPCRLEGSQCNAGYAGACQGNNLLVCVDGYKVPVDCTSIGFDLCGTPPLSKASGCMYAL
jgi:hypothetical protein